MINRMDKLETQTKFSLLITTLALAIFVILIGNTLISMIYILEWIKMPNYDSLLLSLKEGYYTINGQKMGVSIFWNVIGVLFLWGLMVYHTLRTINRPFVSVFL